MLLLETSIVFEFCDVRHYSRTLRRNGKTNPIKRSVVGRHFNHNWCRWRGLDGDKSLGWKCRHGKGSVKKRMVNELVTVANNTVLSFDKILMIYLLFIFGHGDDQSPTAIWLSMNRRQLSKRIPRICWWSSSYHAILTRIGKDITNLEIPCSLSCGSDKPYKIASTRPDMVAV